jgi:pyruvate dehydrogenase E2 component (dihydrolipoamide acetyltransferase)
VAKGLKLLVALALVALGVLAVNLWLFVRHPLAFNAARERAVLRLSGFRPVTVTTSAGSLRAWVKGEGRCLVFLHGAGDQAGTWAAVAPAFAQGFRVVLLDLPGHGASAPVAGPLPLSTLLAGSKEAVQLLCQKGSFLVGNSLGAWLACLLTADSTLAPAGMVLINGGPLRGHYLGSTLTPASRAQAREVMRLLLGEAAERIPGFVLDDVVRAGQQGPIPRLLAALSSWEPYLWGEDQLRHVHVPVLLLWGADDGLFDRAYAEKLAAFLPQAQVQFLPRCGHVPQRQCPQALEAGLRSWLTNQHGEHVAR